MTTWQEQFESERKLFVGRVLKSLEAVEAALPALRLNPNDGKQLRTIAERFHKIAGTSGIFSMTELCELAEDGEEILFKVLRNGTGISSSDLEWLTDCTCALKTILAIEESVPPVESGDDEVSAVTHSSTDFLNFRDVLVVAPNSQRIESLCEAIIGNGMLVRRCENAAEARRAFDNKWPDAMLVVLPLEEGTGYKLVKQLREQPGGDLPPVVMLSDEQGFLDKVEAIRAGVDKFFEEPLDFCQVVSELGHMLNRRRPELFRILSVDDDETYSAYIKATLESAGFNTIWLGDPSQFERALMAFCPDLILLDIVMPEISGFELARFVRQNERFATVPIVFLTTQSQIAAHIESVRSGGDDYLLKPAVPQLLVATITARLERHRMLMKMLQHDPLTQCLNHTTFMERAAQKCSIISAEKGVALLLLDVDDLAKINQTHGFSAGDKVLKSVASILKRCFRQSDLVARVSSDDFAVLIDHLTVDEAESLALDALNSLRDVQHVSGSEIFIASASAGLGRLHEGMDFSELLERTRDGLRKAKDDGKNRIMSLD